VFIIGHFRGRSTGKVFPIGQNDTVFDEQSRTDEGQSQAEYCTSLRASGSMKADSTYIKVIQVKQLFGTDNESNPSGGRVYSVKGIMRTLGSGHGMSQPYIEVKERLRRLTAKECFRLQGFPDEYFERAAAVNSDSQLYKQAGNSVTVNVIYEIAKKFKLGG
jgi:DNA (cytosine-5)-methyltransferase 1